MLHEYLPQMAIDLERAVILFSLSNTALFYIFTVIVFLAARKSALNYALAAQKAVWLLIILLIALPAYAFRVLLLPEWARIALWCSLTVFSWVVLYYVYKSNWPGSVANYVRALASRLFSR